MNKCLTAIEFPPLLVWPLPRQGKVRSRSYLICIFISFARSFSFQLLIFLFAFAIAFASASSTIFFDTRLLSRTRNITELPRFVRIRSVSKQPPSYLSELFYVDCFRNQCSKVPATDRGFSFSTDIICRLDIPNCRIELLPFPTKGLGHNSTSISI